MPLAAPKLDDRRFQDIVDEAKKRIPYYVKEWTDHNVSDPGVTMIELFAWMTDMIIYRLNQVPDLHYIKFMDMMGIQLQEPTPAHTLVTFWLSAPQETPAVIPAGTEVASTQTETQPSIIFTTVDEFTIEPPRLKKLFSSIVDADNERVFVQHDLSRLRRGIANATVFSPRPQEEDALYFGFDQDISHLVLGFDMSCDPAGGAGIDPTMPPYIWEASTGSLDASWAPCTLDPGEDSTKGMNVPGRMRIHLPPLGKYTVNGQNRFWLRLRVLRQAEYTPQMRPYRTSPRLNQVTVTAWGGATKAIHAQRIEKEILGHSDGSAGQIFQLQVTPILHRLPGETLMVHDQDDVTAWKEVDNFSESAANDQHFTLDSINGELRLGPAIRQPDGTIKRFGAIPPRHSSLIFQQYRYGGGLEGNVQAGILNTLKTAIPYIARIVNRTAATGGLDAETLASAMMRTPAMLRSRERAVTESDFEFLARQLLRHTGWDRYRVKCLQPRPSRESRIIPGQVYLLVIPHIQNENDRLRPTAADLELEEDEIYHQLLTFLNERRLLTIRLDVRAPAYHWVAVRVKVRSIPGSNHAQVEADVSRRLYTFLNPLIGGPDGKGWPFGRDLVVSDIYQCLQGIPGIQYIQQVELFITSPDQGVRGDAVNTVEVIGHGVVASGTHEISFA